MTTPVRPIRLYSFPLSGHAHRVELLLSLLRLPFERVTVDLVKGEQKKPDFLSKNAFGQVPVIEDGDITLADSNAIIVYLASRYDESGRWLPRDPVGAAHVQRWLSAAAGPLVFGPGSLRLVQLFGSKFDIEQCRAAAAQLFGVMNQQLATQPWLVAGDAPTIADIALYTYTAHAPEGGVLLERYENVRAWLGRIEALPGFVRMKASPIPADAS
ncbi:glutathione S-transferase family protein [Pendulispora albinea]|uniref:Glutathione S-transferase n=1 Tax=Pendulispora albinea TaxID=2741071 RepID=A0ABZ2LTX7_9BACT